MFNQLSFFANLAPTSLFKENIFNSIQNLLDIKVEWINDQVMSEEYNPRAFAAKIVNDMAINLTMTSAPEMLNNGLVEFFFNGMILSDQAIHKSVSKIR